MLSFVADAFILKFAIRNCCVFWRAKTTAMVILAAFDNNKRSRVSYELVHFLLWPHSHIPRHNWVELVNSFLIVNNIITGNIPNMFCNITYAATSMVNRNQESQRNQFRSSGISTYLPRRTKGHQIIV